MPINNAGLELIKAHEGLRLEAYKDPVGIWTIGYGHTASAGEPAPLKGMKITKAEAEAILRRDLLKFETAVDGAVKRPLNPNQFAALVSFAFNVGPTAFRSSSVLRAVNAGDFAAVPSRLALWNKAQGKVLPGLTRRRKDEGALFLKPFAKPAPKPAIPAAVPIPVEKPKPELAEVLMVGSRGPRVTALQLELQRLNYHSGDIDEIFGNLTRDAVMAFQADNGLKTDGMAGEETWQALKTANPRPLMDKRTNVTSKELAEKGSEIAQGAENGKKGAWATITTGAGIVGAKVTEHASDLANLPLEPLKYAFETWGPYLFGAVIVGAGVFFLVQSRRIGAARVADHQDAKTL